MSSAQQHKSELPPPARWNSGLLLIAGLAIPILGVTLFGYRMFIAEEVAAEVISHKWARSVGLETVVWTEGEGPCNKLPDGLSDIQPKTDSPKLCTFRYPAWQETDRRETSGNALSPAPHWPEFSTTDCTELGCTKLGLQLERYILTLRDPDGTEHECKLSQEHWERLPLGSRPRGKKSLFMERIACRSFELD